MTILLSAAIAGAIAVSFADSLSERILRAFYSIQRKTEKNPWRKILFTRSRCDQCQKEIPPAGLIPIAGYLWQQGKCPHCQNTISARYPALEAAGAAYAALHFYLHGNLFTLAILLSAFPVAAVIFRTDSRYFLIPDAALLWTFMLSLALLGVTFSAADLPFRLAPALLWFAIFYLLHFFSQGKMGMADVRLVLFLGIGLTFWQSLIMPTLAAVLGMVARLSGFHGKKIPFGIYLYLSFFLAALVPEVVIEKLFVK